MKKLLLTFLICNGLLKGFTQVAINTNGAAPHASAMLHVQSQNKGLLIPNIYLANVNDNTTVLSPARGLLVFNTNSLLPKGMGFYYNSGTGAAPVWQPLLDIAFPFYEGTSYNGDLFRLDNYQQSATSTAIKALCSGGTAVVAESSQGYALQTSGKIKIAGIGQTPGAGKILTSDAEGNASWQGAVAFSACGIQPGGAAEFGPGQPKKVAYQTEVYDLGNNFNPAAISPHSTFTAPVKGLYHFDAQIAWIYDDNGFRSSIYLMTEQTNGSFFALAQQEIWKTNANEGSRLSKDVILEAGDKVYINVQVSGTENRKLLTDYTHNYFNGHLVFKL